MKVNAAKCNVCSDTVYSRAPLDLHWCSCGVVTVNGDQGFIGVKDKYEEVEIDLPYSKEKLFNDWNLSIDQLGQILGYEINSRDQESYATWRLNSTNTKPS